MLGRTPCNLSPVQPPTGAGEGAGYKQFCPPGKGGAWQGRRPPVADRRAPRQTPCRSAPPSVPALHSARAAHCLPTQAQRVGRRNPLPAARCSLLHVGLRKWAHPDLPSDCRLPIACCLLPAAAFNQTPKISAKKLSPPPWRTPILPHPLHKARVAGRPARGSGGNGLHARNVRRVLKATAVRVRCDTHVESSLLI